MNPTYLSDNVVTLVCILLSMISGNSDEICLHSFFSFADFVLL